MMTSWVCRVPYDNDVPAQPLVPYDSKKYAADTLLAVQDCSLVTRDKHAHSTQRNI